MRKFLLLNVVLIYFEGFSQDPIHTQFFMVPETLSSSFTGAKQSTRAGIIHRTQWPGLNFSINTQFAFVDNWFEGQKPAAFTFWGKGFIPTNAVCFH